VQIINGVPIQTREWERAVIAHHKGKCANCGSPDRVKAKMIVPEEVGGKLVLSNGTALCRTCDMRGDAFRNRKNPNAKRPVNLWISRRLYDNIQKSIGPNASFSSMGAFVRYVISKYVESPDRFDDLENYQDTGTEVKINCWVEGDLYQTFKSRVDDRGSTVTDVVKALVQMFECNAEPLVLNGSPDGK
jgi:hypothetical protein